MGTEGLVQGTKRRAFLHVQVAAQASRVGSQGFLVPSSALDCSWARSDQPCTPAPLLGLRGAEVKAAARGVVGLGSSLRKPETSQDTHTPKLLPASLFGMSCCQHLQEVGSWWGSTSAMWKRHLWGVVCGGGRTVTEREGFRGLERWPLLLMTKCPVPSLVGLWHVASGQGVGLPGPHPVCCLWPLWEVRIWGFSSWDTVPKPVPGPWWPSGAELQAGAGEPDGHNSLTSLF